jgi:hypothetical protein
MKLREKLAFGMFATSIMSWVITMAITPVGGWCNSNPYCEYYKMAFVMTSAATLLSIAVLMYNSRPTHDEE